MAESQTISGKVYQLKITLTRVRPAVWRRVLVRPETTLDHLHSVIQAVMPWQGGHLHSFTVGGAEYGEDVDIGFGYGQKPKDPAKATLKRVLPREGSSLKYTYDFGDNWEHKVVLEKVLDDVPEQSYPHLITGKCACPLEDCGGAYGYAAMMNALKSPAADRTEEEAEMLEWLGDDFDPAAFDVATANKRLARLSSWP